MSVFTFETKATNPVTADDISKIDDGFGISHAKSKSVDEYAKLLGIFHEACEGIMQMDDYKPKVDLDRFQRTDLHYPSKEENKLNAWAYKFELKDTNPTSGSVNKELLKGHNVALKDCISVAGVPMAIGTNFIKDFVPDVDATLVTRLLECGATIKGKAVCENLCHSATSHSASSGPVHNALAYGYSTGGSSSGSAALVADDNEDIDIGIGVDNGGSVRLPAGWSGLVGLKPTFGLLSCTGILTNEATNDHPGILTKGVVLNSKCLQAIAGSDDIDDRGFNAPTNPYYDDLVALGDNISLKGVRIALLKEGFENAAIEPEVKEKCLAAAKKFEELGATLDFVSIPLHSKGPLIWTGISKIGGYLTKIGHSNGRRGYSMNDLNEAFLKSLNSQEAWDELYPSSANILYNGAYGIENFPLVYGRCMNLSRKLKDEYNACLNSYDLILLPNTPYIAKSHPTISKDSTPLELLSNQKGLSSNTAPFNQSGHPVLALPCGMLPITEGPLADTGVKLPVSLQLVANWYDESMLYKVAYSFERSFDWKTL